MSGIDVSTGGRTSVDTDELHEAAAILETLAAQIGDWNLDLIAAEAALAAVPDAASYDFAARDLASAEMALARAADAATRIGGAAALAATVYGGADAAADGLFDGLGALAGHAFGFVVARTLPALVGPAVVSALPFVAPALVAAGVVWAHPVLRRAVSRLGLDVGGWIAANARHVATPGAVALLGAVVSTSDDIVAGATGLRGRASGGGLAGVASSPFVGAVARLTDTPVVVARATPPTTVAAPAGIAEIAGRIPSTTGGGPQIRVEKYASADGETRWSVYVGGTVELLPVSSNEPFDIESAVGSVAGEDGAAYRAVLDAMADAGIAAEDPVAITGHSQGGLVAAAVAASGEYAVDTVVTFGAPSAQVPVVDGVTTVAVEHSDDLVPALAGTESIGDERTVVTRDTLSREQPGDSLFSAHSIEEYEHTARLMDSSGDRRMEELRAALARIAPEGATGTVTDYRADRVRP